VSQITRLKSASPVDRATALLREPHRIIPAVRRRIRRPVALGGTARPVRKPKKQRLELITRHADLSGLGLEIGPSHNPLLSKADGYNIRIADYLDRDGLLEKYHGVRPTGKIEEVDYVLQGGRLPDEIPDRFDYIVASHVIEHTVCLVCFLEDCAALLRPGGVLTLAVPDHRYCFDYFRERTALGRVIDVHNAGAKVHSEGSVIEHNLNHVKKGGEAAWSAGFPGTYVDSYAMPVVKQRAAAAVAGEYVDTHNWVFTPHQFRLLIHDLNSLGLVTLHEKSFTDTVGPEFFVVLSADGAGPGLTRDQLLLKSAREAGSSEEIRFA
jgi:2-polyprenyl-3-methyl-5-hydroxy-6-metoxy-1,4-benzoquinol methylase